MSWSAKVGLNWANTMDNRTIDVVSEGDGELAMALALIWANAPGGKASHYKEANLVETVRYFGEPTSGHHSSLKEDPAGTPTLIFLWSNERDALPLPDRLDQEGAYTFARAWLRKANYGQEPGHDGCNGKGWRVFTESWGHVAGYSYAIAGIQPAWAMYGK